MISILFLFPNRRAENKIGMTPHHAFPREASRQKIRPAEDSTVYIVLDRR
jgi:hypothetical protein